jgi:hypothetical protein
VKDGFAPLLKHGMVVGINGMAELHSPHFLN